MAFSLGELADVLQARIGRLDAEVQATLLEGAEIVATEAREKLGHYQAEVGPYSAWAPLSPVTQADRVAKGYTPDDPLLRSGELRDAIEVREVREGARIGVFAENEKGLIALSHEFGYYNVRASKMVPPRPFLRPAVWEKLPVVGKLVARKVAAVLKGVS